VLIGEDKPSLDQEPEKYVAIDEKLESLKLELDNMKAKFSPVKENEEMRDTLRTLEDLLQSFDKKSLAEIVNPAEDENQSETEGSSQISRGQLEDQDLKGICININVINSNNHILSPHHGFRLWLRFQVLSSLFSQEEISQKCNCICRIFIILTW